MDKQKVPDLPRSCALCIYSKEHHDPVSLLCHRHAPGPGHAEFEVAEWPLVMVNQRCGQGSAGNDPDKALVPCLSCIHWFRPDGGLPEEAVHDEWWTASDARDRIWWEGMGLCLLRAPSPGVELGDAPTFWRITHQTEGCGDGRHKDRASEE